MVNFDDQYRQEKMATDNESTDDEEEYDEILVDNNGNNSNNNSHEAQEIAVFSGRTSRKQKLILLLCRCAKLPEIGSSLS